MLLMQKDFQGSAGLVCNGFGDEWEVLGDAEVLGTSSCG